MTYPQNKPHSSTESSGAGLEEIKHLFAKPLFPALGLLFLVLLPPTTATPIFNFINVNETECMGIVHSIPEGFFQGVSSITFYERVPQTYPKYTLLRYTRVSHYLWFAQKIIIRNGCDIDHLVHELAHHRQKMQGCTFQQALAHDETFQTAQDEIYEKLEV